MSETSNQFPPDQEKFNDPTPHPSPQVGNYEKTWETISDFGLTEKQHRAIELILQGLRDTQIAEVLSVTRRTIFNWKTRDHEFIRALDVARLDMFCSVSDRYRTLLMRATGVMSDFLAGEAENNRFRAAYALLMMASCFKPTALAALPAQLIEEEEMPIPDLPPKVG